MRIDLKDICEVKLTDHGDRLDINNERRLSKRTLYGSILFLDSLSNFSGNSAFILLVKKNFFFCSSINCFLGVLCSA